MGTPMIRRYDREDSRKEYERRAVDGRRKDYKSTHVPSPEVLTSSVRELLPTPDEASEIRENFAEEGEVLRAVKIGPLKKPAEPVKPAEQEGYASDSSTSSSSSASSAASEAATRTTDVIHRLERNLVNSRDFITQCFEMGQKGVDSMTAAMNSQTDAFLKMVNELQGLNNFFRNERDRREEERRQDRRKTDRRDRPY